MTFLASNQSLQRNLPYGSHRSSDSTTWRNAEQAAVSDKGSTKAALVRDAGVPFSHSYFWSPFIIVGNWR